MAMHGTLAVLLNLCALVLGKTDPGFDLFVFVRSFSPTFCRESACTIKPISAFTIHGLWPEYNSGGWPEFCDGNSSAGGVGSQRRLAAHPLPSSHQGSRSRLRAALRTHRKTSEEGRGGSRIEEQPDAPRPLPGDSPAPPPPQQQQCEWPSFKGPNAGFWEHEWSRHGTCARPVTGDREAFFQTVLRLHEQYDLDAAMAAAGIEPSDGVAYPSRRVAKAVEDAFGVLPMLACFEGDLLELWLCVGLDLKVQQCPPRVVKAQRNRCGKTLRLPEGSPVPSECKSYFPPWNSSNGGVDSNVLVRVITGAAVAGAGVAAVALFWSGIRGRQQRRLLVAAPEQPYDALQSWLHHGR